MRAVAACLLLPLMGIHAADRPLPEAARQVASRLRAGGVVLAECRDGQMRFAHGGQLPVNAAIPPEKILFEIGSITKVFTGLLLAQAVVEKRVTLATPIRDLMPKGFAFADARIGAISLLQLATHTSGLPRLPDNFAAGNAPDDPYARYDEALLFAYLSSAKSKSEGPHPCQYSNLGVGLLGHLLGKVYQTSWHEAVRRKICEPLGLQDTRMTVDAADTARLAPPFGESRRSHSWTFDAVAGAGALRSTAADLLRFGEALLHPETTPLAEAIALVKQPHADAPANGSRIGLCLFIGRRDGQTIYNHDGATGGYCSGLQVIPEQQCVRVALLNSAALSGSHALAALRIEPKRVLPRETTLNPDALQAYPGVYRLDAETHFTILLRDGQLWARLTGQPFLRVFPQAPDRFFYKAVAAELSFQRADGKIRSLTLHQDGREQVAQRTEQPAPAIRLRPPEALQPYVGTYALLGLQKLRVERRGHTLFAQLGDQPAAPVFETAPDRFEYDVVEAALTFTRDAQQRITGLVLQQSGAQLPATRQP